MPLQEINQLDFSGGTNAVAAPTRIGQRQVFRVRNFVLDEHGSLMTRPGYTVVTTGTDTTNPIVLVGVLNPTSGATRPFAVQNNDTVNTLYRTDTDPWTNIGSTGTAYEIPQSVTVVDNEVFAMGYEPPWVWDGTSGNATSFRQVTATSGQTPPSGAKHLAFHLGSLWLWNTSATTTTLDGPSSLRASDANDVNSWPTANQTFISRDDGQVGMGLASFTVVETGISPTATLVAFKNYSTYQITGVFGSSNFSVQKTKSDMGCVAPRTIQFVSGYGVIRLTHKGFALFNGVDDRLLSEEVRPYFTGLDDIAGINWPAVERSYAVQSQNPPLYIAVCPTVSTYLDRFFVYDLVRRAWTICDLPINFQSMMLFSALTTQPEIRAGRNTAGQIVRIFHYGDNTDNGAAINWSVRTRTFSIGSHLRPAFWRRFVLNLMYSPAQSVTVNTTLTGFSSALSSTVSYTGATTGSTYGTAVYGQGTYGTGLTNTIDDLQSVDILRTSSAVYATLTGSGDVRIRGLAFHGSPKPITRRVTAGAL